MDNVIPIHTFTNKSGADEAIMLGRLLQLASPNLPVGGFSFSQGLEWAVECGWINNEKTALDWIHTNLHESLVPTDLAVIKRLYQAIDTQNSESLASWNDFLLASRESKELLAADKAMGKALQKLILQLHSKTKPIYNEPLKVKSLSFTTAFAVLAHIWSLNLNYCQSGYLWTYIENQIAAATKLVPLGQSQAQKLLFKLCEQIPQCIAKANLLNDDNLGASLPGLAMASAWHETQYSRLFRS